MNSKEVSQFIINEIKSLENLIESFNNLSNISKIDIDYALDKTRKVYDLLYQLKHNEEVKTSTIEVLDNTSKENYEAPKIIKEEIVNDSFEPEQEITQKDNESNKVIITENDTLEQELIDESNISIEEITRMVESDKNIINTEEEKVIEPELFPSEDITAKEEVAFNIKDEELIEQITSEKQTVSEKYEGGSDNSLNDLIAKLNETKDLSARLGEAPIANIKSSISLNDKIGYINNLFDGNANKYNETIETLNNFSNLDQALEFINNKFEWKNDSVSFTNFLKIVYRRFMSSLN